MLEQELCLEATLPADLRGVLNGLETELDSGKIRYSFVWMALPGLRRRLSHLPSNPATTPGFRQLARVSAHAVGSVGLRQQADVTGWISAAPEHMKTFSRSLESGAIELSRACFQSISFAQVTATFC